MIEVIDKIEVQAVRKGSQAWKTYHLNLSRMASDTTELSSMQQTLLAKSAGCDPDPRAVEELRRAVTNVVFTIMRRDDPRVTRVEQVVIGSVQLVDE